MAEHEHHEREAVPSLRQSWTNLRQPGPLGWKLKRFFANNASKLAHRRNCCGHPGEPGC